MPESAPNASASEPCPECARILDVSGLEPWSEAVCPACTVTVRVRSSFHHFTLVREVGQGGMSRVFGARDESLGRDLALKILNPGLSQDDRRLRQFEREAMITASISHPHVVKVYTAGRDHGYFYMAMELVEGGSLDEKIRHGGRLREDWVLELGEQVTLGLKAAGEAGLIHRDIKPGNILLSKEGTPKIVDFGLAVFAREGVDDAEIWATPFYVPPETLHGEPEDFRSDLYALGSTLYHALMGKPLFASDSNSLAELKALKSKPADLKEAGTVLSAETVALLERCLKRRPADRYATYDEFLDHLRYARRRLSRGGRGAPWPGSQGLTPRQWALVAVLAAAGLGGTWWWNRNHDPDGRNGAGSAGLMDPAADPTLGTDSTVSSKFLAARQDLANGAFAKARQEFAALAADPAVRQPTLNWARYHGALAALFEGDLAGARQGFAAIRKAAAFSPEPADAPAVHFFQTHAAAMENDLPVPQEHAAECPADSPFAVGLLAGALKNWQLGDLSGSAFLLRAFENCQPPPSAAWLVRYRDTSRPLAEALRAIEAIPAVPLTEKSPEAAAAALERAQTAVTALPRMPELAKAAVDTRLTSAAAAVAALKASLAAEEAGILETKTAVELAELAALEAGSEPFGLRMEFSTGSSRLRGIKASTPGGMEAAADSLRWWENAESFLDVLSHDLATPAEGTVERIQGGPLRGQITGTGEGLRIRPATGQEVTLPCSAFTPASLAALAEKLAERVADSDEYYRRRELLVAFALRSGLKNYAMVSGGELAREHPGFRARWARRSTLP